MRRRPVGVVRGRGGRDSLRSGLAFVSPIRGGAAPADAAFPRVSISLRSSGGQADLDLSLLRGEQLGALSLFGA